MLDQHQVDEIIIKDEIERLKLLFERNNYNKQEKIWFIDSKKITAIENKDQNQDDKLRVVEIYDIPGDLSESKQDDFMVNDFKDDDYVDIDTAINSMEAN